MPTRFDPRSRIASKVTTWMPKGFIRSIQYGTIALADTVASNTATITAVSVANAAVQWLGTSSESTTTQSSYGSVSLTNATTITGSRNVTSLAITLAFVVVEFFPGIVKSVQEAIVTIAAASVTGTATITSVAVERTYLLFRGMMVDSGDTETQSLSRGTLTNATTITATRFNNTNNATHHSTALEFY